MRRAFTVPALLLVAVTAFGQGQESHARLKEKLALTEARMQQVIVREEKLLGEMRKLDAKMDYWIAALHKIRLKIEGK